MVGIYRCSITGAAVAVAGELGKRWRKAETCGDDRLL